MAAQGGTLPPIDTIVRSMRIGPDSVTARVLMPQGSLLAHARTTGVPAVDEDMVGTIYCALAERQRGEPAPLLAQQLRRALAASQPSPEGHSAALVALALFSLGPEAAELFGGVDGTIGTCAARPVTLTLQGRADWATDYRDQLPDYAQIAIVRWEEARERDDRFALLPSPGLDGPTPNDAFWLSRYLRVLEEYAAEFRRRGSWRWLGKWVWLTCGLHHQVWGVRHAIENGALLFPAGVTHFHF